MKQTERYEKLLLDNLYEGIYLLDKNRKILYWSKGAERLTGYSSEEVVGNFCSNNILVHVDSAGKELCRGNCPVSRLFREHQRNLSAYVYLHHKDGHRVPVHVRISSVEDNSGNIIGAAEVFWTDPGREVDEAYIEELKKAALLDPLTDVSNRRGIDLELVSTVEESKRHAIPYGLIFADIDNFKQINDEYGHEVGDKILQMVARTLSVSIRAYDHLGRWGGEEFLIIAKHITEDELIALATTLNKLVSKSFLTVNGVPLSVTMTMGIAHSANCGGVELMMTQVDRNLLKGKSSGKNCVISDR